MPRLLPAEFDDLHQLAFEWHDALAEYVAEAEAKHIHVVRGELRDPAHAEIIGQLSQSDAADWMDANGYGDLLDEYAYRHLVIALLTDFCQFVYEALRCSEKGKLTVTYALLRKPFRDNLLYLEWMLADRADFMARFRRGGQAIDAAGLSPERRLAVIRGAMAKCPCGDWLEPEFIHELRYDKASDFGFEATWHKAVHLVTTARQYPTEPYNLNFIFSDDDSRLSLWDGLYLPLITLLLHTWEVVRAVVAQFAPDFRPGDPWLEARRVTGFLLIPGRGPAGEGTAHAREFLNDLFEEARGSCAGCRSILTGPASADAIERFYRAGVVPCPGCGSDVILGGTEGVEEDVGQESMENHLLAAFEEWADEAGLSPNERTEAVVRAFVAGVFAGSTGPEEPDSDESAPTPVQDGHD